MIRTPADGQYLLVRPDIGFLPLDEDRIRLMASWLRRPHVAEWWGTPDTLEQLRDDYLVNAGQPPLVRGYIATLDGRPFGFIQSYVVKGAGGGWWEDETDPGARGIDQFLAEESDLGRGLGTLMVRTFVERLFADPEVTKVQTDPSPDNGRAIRCYEKAGFRRLRVVATPDGPALLMILRRRRGSATIKAPTTATRRGPMRVMLLLVLLAAPSIAAAQFSWIEPGTRVRVWIPEPFPQMEGPARRQLLRGTVAENDGSVLRLSVPGTTGAIAVPQGTIRRLEVSKGVSRPLSMIERAIGGAAGGAITFALMNDPRRRGGPRYRTDWRAAGVGASWGAGIGAVIGLVFPHEHWDRARRRR